MTPHTIRFGILLVAISIFSPPASLAAELPTAEEILQIHRANKERLARLHLQVTHSYEMTEAYARAAHKEADEAEKILQYVAGKKPEDIEVTGAEGKIQRAEFERILAYLTSPAYRQEISWKRETKPFRTTNRMELFLDGSNYQYRSPITRSSTDEAAEKRKFPVAPLTPESLLGAYCDIGIFSRSSQASPAARWWHHSADGHAYVTNKHLTDVWCVDLPPFTSAIQAGWGDRHPFDAFFSQPADRYRVVRQEELDGRTLTVVDVTVPIGPNSSNHLYYNAWLDLQRGAIPIKLHQTQRVSSELPESFTADIGYRTTITTHEINELPNGAYYPVRIVAEDWRNDPDAAALTAEEWAEVHEGKREAPSFVVHSRHAWECTLVEIKERFVDGFFVLPFPDGQTIFDHDAAKVIGALDPKPLVKVGQQAPPLSVGRWLDGKQRTLDDLRGQVVVLEFWGLWCGACRSSVPRLKAMQERFGEQPVTFISIHNAEKDVNSLAERIEEFERNTGWKYVGAIDSGTMLENSLTANAYGIVSFPTRVVIGPDGAIIYVDPHFEDAPDCNEEDPAILADIESKCDKLWKERFEAVGEPWPKTELSDAEKSDLYIRVNEEFIARQIEAALKTR